MSKSKFFIESMEDAEKALSNLNWSHSRLSVLLDLLNEMKPMIEDSKILNLLNAASIMLLDSIDDNGCNISTLESVLKYHEIIRGSK